MKALLLASWYPNKLSPFNGDFIKRHAEATSLYEDVYVIYVVRDIKGEITKDVCKEEIVSGRLTEMIIYYHSPSFNFKIFDKYISDKKYQALYRRAVKDYIEKKGRPDIVHVHVGYKAGIVALWLRKKFAIPYVVSEHWTGFLAESKENFSGLPVFKKRWWRKIMQRAAGFSAVSEHLKNALTATFRNSQGRVITNVVNRQVFYPMEEKPNEKPVFVHVSNLQPYKNPEMILRAFKMLTNHYPEARLDMIGGTDEKLLLFVKQMGLERNVAFQNEKPQPLLADDMRNATALILYSQYETFGCVIIEANACGIPVIVSDIPVFHETVREGENGVFARPDDPEDLAQKMLQVLKTRSSFDSRAISLMTGSNYGYETVGKQISRWYQQVIKGN